MRSASAEPFPARVLRRRSIRLSAEQWAKIEPYGLEWLRQLVQLAKAAARADY
jgi:hypothetical protein